MVSCWSCGCYMLRRSPTGKCELCWGVGLFREAHQYLKPGYAVGVKYALTTSFGVNAREVGRTVRERIDTAFYDARYVELPWGPAERQADNRHHWKVTAGPLAGFVGTIDQIEEAWSHDGYSPF